jgi:hypothetical protein
MRDDLVIRPATSADLTEDNVIYNPAVTNRRFLIS